MRERNPHTIGAYWGMFSNNCVVCVSIASVVLISGCATFASDKKEQASSSTPPLSQASQTEQKKPHIRRGPRPPKASGPTVVKSRQIEPTVVSYTDYRDPLIKLNRTIFAFNDVTYRYAFIPLGKRYRKSVPEPVQTSISNFFDNIKSPVYVVNHLLQGEFKPAGRNLARFGINTTVGIFGFFDPAQTRWHFEKEQTYFDNTLENFGAGYGFYLVLPLLGPSDARNGAAQVVDYFLNPLPYITENPETTIIQAVDGFQAFAPQADTYETLREKSEDPYIYFRNMHLQGLERDANY